MIKRRSIGFASIAILAASATVALCSMEALNPGPSLPWVNATLAAVPSGAAADPLASLVTSPGWLTGKPEDVQSLRGKVVVVNFWTYSCINSLRALPYLRAWSERYGSKGLLVIGVHAPEFEFEKDAAKVRLADDALGIGYPVLQDNDYRVWRAFGNEGWPGFGFIDAQGRMRAYRLGEGNYAEAEHLIRTLLAEAGHDPSEIPPSPVSANGVQAQADWSDLQSPESYVGYAKAENFRSPGGIRRDAAQAYVSAASLARNQWDLAGEWVAGREFATLSGPTGAIRFRFHARDLHLVLGGAADHQPVRFRLTIDGAAPGIDHGVDVDEKGWGTVNEDRLYQLVRQRGAIGDRTVTIEFERPGVRAYVFTFG